MSALLPTRMVERPWGRTSLPAPFAAPAEQRIGEVWFEPPVALEQLLVKYIFTSQALSVQVHPSDAQAPAGHRGKEECWLVIAAEPGAKLGIGFDRALSADAMRRAALDGSIEDLLTWHPARPGDFFYIPAGTVHAIGAGIGLIEVQQNSDITYRLYDYGRPRELHLDAGIAVSNPVPFVDSLAPTQGTPNREILVEGGKFVIERLLENHGHILSLPTPAWIIPVTGGGRIDEQPIEAGECWMIEGQATINLEVGSDVLLAYPGAKRAIF